jgi:acetyltransferase-like isoleucine patch superfamily enzyme
VVAANAVVTRDVPPGSVASGVPADIRPVDGQLVDLLFGPLQARASR